MRHIQSLSVLAVAAFAGACMSVETVDFDPADFMTPPDRASSQALERGSLTGELGRFQVDVDEPYGYVNVHDQGFSAEVRGRGTGVVMAYVEVMGHDMADLEVGDVLYGGFDDRRMGSGDSEVFMVGCGGEVDDKWEVDEPAEEAEVEVTDVDEDGVEITFTGTLANGDVLDGSARIDR